MANSKDYLKKRSQEAKVKRAIDNAKLKREAKKIVSNILKPKAKTESVSKKKEAQATVNKQKKAIKEALDVKGLLKDLRAASKSKKELKKIKQRLAKKREV